MDGKKIKNDEDIESSIEADRSRDIEAVKTKIVFLYVI
jgi:hypothetical protein